MRFPALLGLTLGLGLLLTASARGAEAPAKAGGGILRAGNGGEPQRIDPQQITGVLESNIVRALFEGLCVDHPSQDGIVLPGAAERWHPDKEFRVWTFHLRPNAAWSDGHPLTTGDFLFAYRRILTPEFQAPFADMLYFIQGAEAYHTKRSERFADVGVKALDDHTLQITLRDPLPFLPEIAKHFSWFPVPRHIVSNLDNQDQGWTRPGTIVGNGPFTLKAWEPGKHLEVARNPRYWDAATVKLEGIRFFPIADSETEARQFFAGNLHLTFSLSSRRLLQARKTHPAETRSDLSFGTRFLRCNVTRPPLNDVRVRQALALAIDRPKFIRESTGGYHSPASGLVPPFGGYQASRAVRHDPKKAREFLAAAGYADGAGFPRLKLLTKDHASSLRMARSYQAMWETTLGIKVEIEQKEWTEYLTAMNTLQYDLADTGWIGDILDPTTFLGMWIKDGPNNRTGWAHNEFEELLARANRMRDRGERYRVLQGCEEILLDELPVIPVFWYATAYLLSDKVRGWHPLLLGAHPYKFLSLAETSP